MYTWEVHCEKSCSVKIVSLLPFIYCFLNLLHFIKKSTLYGEEIGGYQRGSEWGKMHKGVNFMVMDRN